MWLRGRLKGNMAAGKHSAAGCLADSCFMLAVLIVAPCCNRKFHASFQGVPEKPNVQI